MRLKIDARFEMGESNRTASDKPEGRMYVVERIIADRVINGTFYYRLKWKGYPDSQNTWEPETNLQAAELLAEYRAAKQSPPAPNSPPSQAKDPKIKSIRSPQLVGDELVFTVEFENGDVKTLTQQEVRKRYSRDLVDFYESMIRQQ
jgi:chromobox protein 5